jgi:hypothetical protein
MGVSVELPPSMWYILCRQIAAIAKLFTGRVGATECFDILFNLWHALVGIVVSEMDRLDL